MDSSDIVLIIYVLVYMLAFSQGQITRIGGLQDFASKFIYFFTGFICYKYDDILKLRNASFFRIAFLGICACLFLIIEILLMNMSHFTWARLILPATSIFIVIFGYSIVNKMLNMSWIKNSPVFERINKLSYGIYVCHPWLIDSITSSNFIVSIAREYTILFPLALFIFTLVISIMFAKLMLETKIGKFLIG